MGIIVSSLMNAFWIPLHCCLKLERNDELYPVKKLLLHNKMRTLFVLLVYFTRIDISGPECIHLSDAGCSARYMAYHINSQSSSHNYNIIPEYTHPFKQFPPVNNLHLSAISSYSGVCVCVCVVRVCASEAYLSLPAIWKTSGFLCAFPPLPTWHRRLLLHQKYFAIALLPPPYEWTNGV